MRAGFCTVLTRLAAIILLSAGLAAPWQAAAADSRLHARPLQSVSRAEETRRLDWRSPEATAAFTLPAGAGAENLRIVLAASPGEAAPRPGGRISVTLNGSPPAMLHPEAFPFTAQVDFPGQYLQDGFNQATIRYLAPDSECFGPNDGAWIVDLDQSRIELQSAGAHPDSLEALDALLGSELLSPDRIAIDAASMPDDERAAFEVWAAMAMAMRAPRTPEFVADAGEADLIVRFVADDGADTASLTVTSGSAPILNVRARDPHTAIEAVQAYARQAEQLRSFATPVFDRSWAPEAGHAAFALGARPERAILHLKALREADAGAASQLRIALNGHELEPEDLSSRRHDIAVRLPSRLLVPGLNRISFTPELVPARADAPCIPVPASPLFRIGALRVDGFTGATAPDLFGFAAGDFGAGGAWLALPALSQDDRAAQLRLIAEIARRSGHIPDIANISARMPAEPAANLVVVAPLASLPADLLHSAPGSLLAVLRGERTERPRIRVGTKAMADAASIIQPAAIAGAAARYAPDEASERTLTLVTEASGATFGATIDALVDGDLLGAFEGRVMRWSRREASMQDLGPWRAPAVTMVSPPQPGELHRTMLFMSMVGGLSIGWVMARGRKPRAKR